MGTLKKIKADTSYSVSKHPRAYTTPCNNMKLRMVIGGWTDYYVNHSDDWVAFDVHGTRVNVLDNDLNGDKITFQWGFNILTVTIENVIKALQTIDNWLEA